MEKIFKKFLVGLALGCCVLFGATIDSQAGFETFQLLNHPNGFGLTLYGPGVVNGLFSFNNDMMMAVDTTTGTATISGTMANAGGFQHSLSVTLTNLRPSTGSAAFPQPVPYAAMFDNMDDNSNLRLTWDSVDLDVVRLYDLSFNPAKYGGPLNWHQKADATGNADYLYWQKFSPNLFGASGWLSPDGNYISTNQSGDFHFNLQRTTQTIPEPATMALLSLGLGGMGFIRRRKKI